MLAGLSLLTGLAYPLLVTVLAHGLFPGRAGGSLLRRDGQVVGSALLAQRTVSPRYIWPRPSAVDFATVPSGASHGAPTSAALRQRVEAERGRLRLAHPGTATAPVPSELLYTSGSGLDPHLSPAGALFQAGRVAGARGLAPSQVEALIGRCAVPPQFSLLGEARVNVLQLNMALDELK